VKLLEVTHVQVTISDNVCIATS